METVLNDTTKFKMLEHDPIKMTFKRENKVRHFLSTLKADNVISDELHNKFYYMSTEFIHRYGCA